MIDKEMVIKSLDNVPLETKDVIYFMERIVKSIKESQMAYELLISTDMYDLVSIASQVDVWNYAKVSVTLDIPWSKQTLARHLYGSCFPESMERDVTVWENCNGAWVARRYTLKTDNGYVHIRFYRKTFSGDKVDGCVIQQVTRRPYYQERVQPQKYFSIHCPL